MCSRLSNKWHLIPQEFGSFDADGHHGAVVSVSDTPCGDDCDTSKETICEVHTDIQYGDIGYAHDVNVPYPVPVQIDCKGAKGRYVRIRLPGKGTRLLPHAAEIAVHRNRFPTPSAVPSATDSMMPMTCYGVQARELPAADDPNVLAETKKHPMQIVVDNPEDPIFYSSCLVREVAKVWMPLRKNDDTTAAQHRWYFNDGGHCLDCDSYTQNYVDSLSSPYEAKKLKTVHWWLQPQCGACEVCAPFGKDLSGLPADAVLKAMGRKECPTSTPSTHQCHCCLRECFLCQYQSQDDNIHKISNHIFMWKESNRIHMQTLHLLIPHS